MTLVLSLRQQLSGSKIGLLGILLLFISSCGNINKTQTTTEVVKVVIPEKDNDLPEQPETKDPKEEDVPKEEEKDHEKKDDEIDLKKSVHNIAFLMPLELDNAPQSLDYTTPDQNPFKSSTRMAIELYQGFTLALDKLKGDKFMANIYIIDTENSESRANQIVQQAPFPKIDLIVGPVFNKQLRQVANYAKSKKIPMISPLSSSTSITHSNPYYYSANATASVHYEALFNHMQEDFESKNLYIFHQNTTAEKDIISQFEKFNSKLDTSNNFNITIYEMATDQKSHELKEMLDSLETSLVLIPSYNEAFVEYSLNQLAQIIHHYPSTVFGMPKWLEFRNVNFDYLEWMNVQITSSYFSDLTDRGHSIFISDFREKYGYEPSTYSKQAYDLTLFLAKNLSKSYKKGEMLLKNADFTGIQTNFDFEPVLKDDDEIDFISNKFVHLLEFKDFQFKKINR